MRRERRGSERRKAAPEDAATAGGTGGALASVIRFEGDVTPEVEEDFRRAYLARSPLDPFASAALGGLLLTLGTFLPDLLGVTRFALVVPGALLLLRALALPWLWWLVLRSRLRRAFGGHVSGSVGPDGLTYGPAAARWERLRAAKVRGRAALVHLDRLEALPIHRSWLASEEGWQLLLSTLRRRLPARGEREASDSIESRVT